MGCYVVFYKLIHKVISYVGTDNVKHFSAVYTEILNIGFWSLVNFPSNW